MSERTELSTKYIQYIHGTQYEDYIKRIVESDDSTDINYLKGAEQITIKTIQQLQALGVAANIMLIWTQILAYISYEIEKREAFVGNE